MAKWESPEMEDRRAELRKRVLTKEDLREEGSGFFRFVRLLCIIAFIAAVGFGVYFEYINYEYQTYEVVSELTMSGIENSTIFEFGEGNVVLGADSVTYLKDHEIVWTTSVSVDNPVFEQEGNYFAVYETGGYQLYVFDKTGLLTTVKVSRQIYDMDISSSGVTAVFTVSDEYAYISYFDRYGQKISVEVRTVLSSTGYPMDMAISPDGQRLAVAYYSVMSGIGESRFVLYDFKNGKESASYVVSKYEDYCDTDTLLMGILFLDDTHVLAFGDNRISFMTLDAKGQASRTDVSISDTVISAILCDDRVLLYTESQNFNNCSLYENNGSIYNSFEVSKNLKPVTAKNGKILFQNGQEIAIYNVSGRRRYEGTLSVLPVSINFTGSTGILFSTVDEILEYRFY